MSSRWKCPKCNSTDVIISLPTWYSETRGCELTFVETDAEADVMYWACNSCDGNDIGAPIDTLESNND